MSDVDVRIQSQVAFKAAVELIAAEVIVPETPDLGPEIKEWTEIFYDVISAVVAEKGGDSAPKSQATKRSSGGSKRKASTRGGNTSTPKPKNPGAAASDAQIRFLKRLLNENDIEFDEDSFDWEGYDVQFSDLTMGNVNEYIEPLKG